MPNQLESEQAQETERRYRYRTMILRRKLFLPRAAVVRMVGPDCAYHLYGQHQSQGGSVGGGE